MNNKEIILQAVLEAIDEFNGQLPKEDKLEKSGDTVLFGNRGRLDSLGLVSLVTTVEQKVEEKCGISLTLLEDIDLLENDNPFETVDRMVDHIGSIVEKKRA